MFSFLCFVAVATFAHAAPGNGAQQKPHGCQIELTSLLKSGSTWTEIITLMLAERACSNDPDCTFKEIHSRGRAANNRTIGFALRTDNERDNVQWEMCNKSIVFNSAQKHNFWGTSFYREGVSAHRSFFSLLERECVNKDIPLDSEACVKALSTVAPDMLRKKSMHTEWLTIACLRDPRAVAVSECHWMGRGFDENRPPCSETTTKFDTLVYATAFLYHYWKAVLPRRSHLMVYEKMIQNPVAEYRLLADFMGVSPLLSDADIAEIASETTATALARKEAEGKLLGKTKVSKFNPTQKVKSYKKTAADDHVGFEGLEGAKVFRGTAKGFMEDVSEEELSGMNNKMRKYLPNELLELYGVTPSE
eukprot:INCI2760.2.p1 GENE.INCI2760.2~~INCI2760.2.p1  ORF type:complete len:363 (-),score=53.48 INCI2760.2:237-1325(-)